jgi:hypothetical protein
LLTSSRALANESARRATGSSPEGAQQREQFVRVAAQRAGLFARLGGARHEHQPAHRLGPANALVAQPAELAAQHRGQREPQHLAHGREVVARQLEQEAEQLGRQHRLGLDAREHSLELAPVAVAPRPHREHHPERALAPQLDEHARAGLHRQLGGQRVGERVPEGHGHGHVAHEPLELVGAWLELVRARGLGLVEERQRAGPNAARGHQPPASAGPRGLWRGATEVRARGVEHGARQVGGERHALELWPAEQRTRTRWRARGACVG